MTKASYLAEGPLRYLQKFAAISGVSPLRNGALVTTAYGTGVMLTENSKRLIDADSVCRGAIVAEVI